MPEVTQEYLTQLRWDMHHVLDKEDEEPSLTVSLAELNALVDAAEKYLIIRPLVDAVPSMTRPDFPEIETFWGAWDEVQEKLTEWDS